MFTLVKSGVSIFQLYNIKNQVNEKVIYHPLLLMITVITVFSQDSGIRKWQLLKTVNKIDGRSECSLVAVKGKLYLIGGDGPIERVEVYDPITNTWTKKAKAINYKWLQWVDFPIVRPPAKDSWRW